MPLLQHRSSKCLRLHTPLEIEWAPALLKQAARGFTHPKGEVTMVNGRGQSVGIEDRAPNITEQQTKVKDAQAPGVGAFAVGQRLLMKPLDKAWEACDQSCLSRFCIFSRSLETYLSLPEVTKVTPDAWTGMARQGQACVLWQVDSTISWSWEPALPFQALG